MRLVRYRTVSGTGSKEVGPVTIGVLEGEEVVPLHTAAGNGDDEILAIAMTRTRPDSIGPPVRRERVRLLPPLGWPPAIRDFLTFEGHYANFLLGQTGSAAIPDEWYRTPVFYFTSPAVVFGPDDVIPRPQTTQLDFELEVAAILGRGGSDVCAAEAGDLIAGYTMFNDFSARDIQRREMSLGLGASKCKDFANAFGPCLATPDELAGEPGNPEGAVRARVNGVEIGGADLAGMQHSFAALIAHASTSSRLRPGDIFGSGTATTGCLMELGGLHGHDKYPWLEPGDVVDIEADGIGTLRNTIGGAP